MLSVCPRDVFCSPFFIFTSGDTITLPEFNNQPESTVPCFLFFVYKLSSLCYLLMWEVNTLVLRLIEFKEDFLQKLKLVECLNIFSFRFISNCKPIFMWEAIWKEALAA